MKKFVFIAFLGVLTLMTTAQVYTSIPAPPPETTFTQSTYEVTCITSHATPTVEVGEALRVQDAYQLSTHPINPVPVKSVEKTHSARYNIDDCLSSIVVFPNGRCVTSYDLRQKSNASVFSFIYQSQRAASIRRCLLS